MQNDCENSEAREWCLWILSIDRHTLPVLRELYFITYAGRNVLRYICMAKMTRQVSYLIIYEVLLLKELSSSVTFPLSVSVSVHKVASVWLLDRLISLRRPEKVSVCILVLVFVWRKALMLNTTTLSHQTTQPLVKRSIQ